MEIVAIFIALGVLFLGFILVTGYVKASPDKAIIISGLRKNPKVLIGKAGVKIPFLERRDELSLQLIPIDVKTSSSVPTADYININVDAAVNVKVSDKPDRLKLAAQNFLNKRTEYIAQVAREVLEGNMREIVGQMKLEDMVSDRQMFATKVKENAEPDLGQMGLDIVSFNVQNFVDKESVIENLGVDNVVKISKNAAISRANSEKEIAIAQAQARKEANDAQILSETEIAKKQNELAIQKAELKKDSDIKKAIADAAYKIQEEEQRKTVEITTANANLARQEKELELKEREVAIKERALEAEVKKTAEAQKYAAQQRADAEQYEREKKAEAELFEIQKKAEAEKARAEAEKFARLQEAEAVKAAGIAEAAAVAAKGKAEAEAIQAKAIAEAEGTLKKAEAMKQYGDAARQQMELDTLKVYFEQLPKIAEAVSQGYASVESIKLFGGDASQLSGNILTTVTQVTDGIKESTGIDPNALLSGFLGAKVASSKETEQDCHCSKASECKAECDSYEEVKESETERFYGELKKELSKKDKPSKEQKR